MFRSQLLQCRITLAQEFILAFHELTAMSGYALLLHLTHSFSNLFPGRAQN